MPAVFESSQILIDTHMHPPMVVVCVNVVTRMHGTAAAEQGVFRGLDAPSETRFSKIQKQKNTDECGVIQNSIVVLKKWILGNPQKPFLFDVGGPWGCTEDHLYFTYRFCVTSSFNEAKKYDIFRSSPACTRQIGYCASLVKPRCPIPARLFCGSRTCCYKSIVQNGRFFQDFSALSCFGPILQCRPLYLTIPRHRNICDSFHRPIISDFRLCKADTFIRIL